MTGRKILAALAVSSMLFGCGTFQLKQDSLSFDEHMRLGEIYEGKGEYELAVREYESAQEIDMKNASAYFALGNANLRLKKYEPAEKSYLKAIELKPMPEYYNNLGLAYMEKGDFNAARKSAAEAIKSAPDGERFIYLDTLGMIQTRAGELGPAEDTLVKAAASVPANRKEALLEIYTHLADVYRAGNRPEDAAVLDDKIKLFKSSQGEKKEGI